MIRTISYQYKAMQISSKTMWIIKLTSTTTWCSKFTRTWCSKVTDTFAIQFKCMYAVTSAISNKQLIVSVNCYIIGPIQLSFTNDVAELQLV